MNSVNVKFEDAYLEAYKAACDERAKLEEECGVLEGKLKANAIRQQKLKTVIAVYERRQKQIKEENA